MTRDSSPPGGTQIIAEDVAGFELPLPDEPPEALPIPLLTGTGRYAVERVVARGSMGVIKIARDLTLKRLVALKELDAPAGVPDAAARFLAEARITAQLQHPSIVAVYEIGQEAGEKPFFAMQLIEGRTLAEVIEGLRAGHPDVVPRFGRQRLLQLFSQICMGVAYAHARGVIHRDLKPANIMLGEFGEVFVMDWGLAKVVRTDVPAPIDGSRDEARFSTRVGHITGTPAYMSPEQAMGLVDGLSEATDIYALGALLYELLTLHPPFEGQDTEGILARVRQGAVRPPSVAWPAAEVPPELEAITLRCLARDPADRYRSAVELADEIAAAQGGGHTRLGRVRTQARSLREAHRAGQRFRELARHRRRLSRAIAERAAARLPSDGPEHIAEAWAERRQLAALEAELELAFEHALGLFSQVIGEDSDNREAHEGLRDLAWYRFLEAERLQDPGAMQVYRALARQHDPAGSLRAALTGDGALTVLSLPAGASVRLAPYVRDARGDALVPGPARDLGRTPVSLDPVPMGSYRLCLETPEARLELPLLITRQEHVELMLHLPAAQDLPAGTALVPAGPFLTGSPEPVPGALPPGRQHQPAFLLSQLPVTCGAYAAFLAALIDAGETARARSHLPQAGAWQRGTDGRYYPGGALDNPVTGISARDAEAYCAWRGAVDGLPWRLPQGSEWEKAARGVDGRPYPWGMGFEPTRCRCAESPAGGAPSPVGEPQDESPYGIRDLAGGVREWTATAHPRSPRLRELRGGGFRSPALACHLAARAWAREDHRADDLGFRMALDAPDQRRGGR